MCIRFCMWNTYKVKLKFNQFKNFAKTWKRNFKKTKNGENEKNVHSSELFCTKINFFMVRICVFWSKDWCYFLELKWSRFVWRPCLIVFHMLDKQILHIRASRSVYICVPELLIHIKQSRNLCSKIICISI